MPTSSSQERKKICIISFSQLCRDARVLRQIRHLSPHFDLTVIGFGPVPAEWADRDGVEWKFVPPSPSKKSAGEKISYFLQLCRHGEWKELVQKVMMRHLYLGRLKPDLFEHWYWSQPIFVRALELAASTHSHAYLANDWNSLPLAAEAASRSSARVLFDAHEYAPLEYDNPWWRINYRPLIENLLRRYLPRVDAFTTVGPGIAQRYRSEFNVDPVVIMNAPELNEQPRVKAVSDSIHLVHHGAAFRVRRLEQMIKVIRHCDPRYHLHFLLISEDPAYIQRLQRLAQETVPRRVHFHQPVSPNEIIGRISQYDMGIYLFTPSTYNDEMALPNKFFDFIAAGLPVCIGPSPEMAAIVRRFGLGCVAPSFRPQDMAAMLNQLSAKDLQIMQRASLAAAQELNAQREMKKLLEIFRTLLQETASPQEPLPLRHPQEEKD